MKKLILIALLGLAISSCGPVYMTGERGRGPYDNPPGWEKHEDRRGRTWEENRDWNNGNRRYDDGRYNNGKYSDRYSYLLFVKGGAGYRDLTVVIDNRVKISMGRERGDNYQRELRMKPGRHSIKVYQNGRYLYSRWIEMRPGSRIKIVI